MEMAAEVGGATSKLALSRFLGVSQGCMQAWERGQLPSAKDMLTMHKKLGFSYSWLISGEGEPFAEQGSEEEVAALQEKIEKMREEFEEVTALQDQVKRLREELEEERALNRQLTRRLLLDSGPGKQSSGDVA